jgi:hypothetical protein
MPRKHLFLVVVLLGAVVVAGLLAVTRTVVLAQPSSAATGSDPAIAFRLAKLDRFEASLERRAAKLKATPTTAAPVTVYRRAPSTQVAAPTHGDDDGEEHEFELSDD